MTFIEALEANKTKAVKYRSINGYITYRINEMSTAVMRSIDHITGVWVVAEEPKKLQVVTLWQPVYKKSHESGFFVVTSALFSSKQACIDSYNCVGAIPVTFEMVEDR